MIKKLLFATFLLLAPTFANAWVVNSKTSPATGMGTVSPLGNVTYANGVNSGEYTVTPYAGYAVTKVTVDGIATSPNANGKYVVPYTGQSTRYLIAYLAAKTVSITTQITSGSGAIREDNWESLTKIPVGSSRQLLVIPNPGYAISSVTAAGATITDNPDGSKLVVYSNLQTDQSVSAAFSLVQTLTVSAGGDITLNGDGPAYAGTLYGSASGNQGSISYAWSGAGLSFGTPNAATTTVYGALPGTYTATLTATSGSLSRQDSATVTVWDRTQYLENECTGCHSGNTPQVVAEYDASEHKVKDVSCQDCHTANTPHNAVPSCLECHNYGNSRSLPWPPTGLTFHNAYTDTNQCYGCHNRHDPGVLLEGGAPYPHFSSDSARYVTPNVLCDNCHTSAVDNAFHIYPAHAEWSASGKGDPLSPSWTAYDFKNRGSTATPASNTGDDCVRCHTTTGYINYVTSNYTDIKPWGTADDQTKEMLACSACHNTPFDAEFSTRGFQRDEWDPDYVVSWGPATPSAYYNYESAATGKIFIKRDLPQSIGKSNICVACHTGKAAGSTIKAISAKVGGGGTGTFWQNVDFVSPHYMGAAGIVYRLSGYTYRTGTSYDNPPNYAHFGLGNGYAGNCVTCHMSSPERHSAATVTKAADGTITAITSGRCVDCHAAGATYPIPDGAALEALRSGYDSSLRAVAELLALKGIHFNGKLYPYFFTTPDTVVQSYATRTVNWDAGAPTYRGADVMGAAFNLMLLYSEKGAYTHNSAYTKRLLYDTIDYLDNGSQDNSTATALQNLTVTEKFTQSIKEKAQSYLSVRP